MTLWPLIQRFPSLASLPRVTLRSGPTPVTRAGDRLWVKRDDLTASPIGGNKVRALEFLLAQHPRGSRVITGGSRGSTHVLATTIHGEALGLKIMSASWPQEMNAVAHAVDARLAKATRRHFGNPVAAALWLTWRSWRGDRVIPAGGTSPLGILGHVNAALELAEQVRIGELPQPARVVVPLGTGGTIAGLALGFKLAGLETTVIGARVVPRIIGRASRVRRLIRATARLIGVDADVDIEVADGVYGGAYGRPLAGAPNAMPNGIPLDPTYSAKAFVAALAPASRADTLFWLTFDSRWMNA